jgi:pimeloyl-ACP methyl ester carboxylesterase
MVDIGGYRLYINCQGQGSPTIVMDGGFGAVSLDWMLVQPAIAKFTRACSYDRAGFGWSDPPAPGVTRTSQQLALELHSLLVNAATEGPYVFVAQSFGGGALLFADQYPDEVAGLVLIDTANEFMDTRFADAGVKVPPVIPQLKFFARLTHLRIGRWLAARLLERMAASMAPQLQSVAPQWRAMLIAQRTDPQNFRFGVLEAVAARESLAQVRATRRLGNLPLVVLTPASSSAPWMAAQKDLMQLSTRSKHIIVENTGHEVHYSRPDVVIEVVQNMVESIRQAHSP